MSSPSNNPYKSRVLNLINRQSLRLREQLNQTGRHLKIAVEMGVQILIYPLYLLVQTGRMAQRQLKQKIQQQQFISFELGTSSRPQSLYQSQLEPISGEQPIEHFLETLDPLLFQGKESISPSAVSPALEEVAISSFTHLLLPKNNNLVIQGIATLLENQKLVLVTPENLLIDIFSPTQQKQLKQRICLEIANYQYQRRLQEYAAKKFPSLIPSFQINSPNVLPPVRWFWTVMRWIQTSQVALAINLFGESSLFSNLTRPKVATFANKNLLIEKFTPIKSHQDIYLITQEKNKKLTQEPDPFQIKVLIQAAIDYFFGQHYKQVSLGTNKTTPTLSTASSTQPLSNVPEPDPWLSWDDLFSQDIPQENTKKPTDSTLNNSAKLPATKTSVKERKTFLEQIQQNIPQQDNAKSLSIQPSKDIQLSPKTPSKTIVAAQTSATITPISSQTNQLEATPEWIETEATPVGYVKHPLVRILEVLDLIIFGFEKLWLRFWNWLKRNKNFR